MEERPIVGVLEPDRGDPERPDPDDAPATDAVADDLESAGATVLRESPSRITAAEPSFAVAVGEAEVLALARAGVTVPVLPVAAGRGLRSVGTEHLESAVAAVVDGRCRTVGYPLLSMTAGDRSARMLFDATVVTSEPARISEYAISADGAPVATVRADGVVVATPAGSRGYARAAGGPLVAPGSDSLSVIPIAPFVTDAQQWVLHHDRVELTVKRDAGGVSVLADDRTVGTVGCGGSVGLTAEESLDILVVEASQPFFSG